MKACRALIVCALLVTVSSGLAPREAVGAVGIKPAFVEVDLDRGRPAGKFIISNPGDTKERYRVKVIHFQFMPDGGLRQIAPDEMSLAKYIKFNPKELALRPKTRRAVRFVILRRGKLKPGEYWAGMEGVSQNTTVGSSKDAAGRVIKVQVIPSILVPIFGTSGKITYKGVLDSVEVKEGKQGRRLECVVSNPGNGRLLLRGRYMIADASGKTIAEGTCGYSYIFRGSKRRFGTKLKGDVPKGKYVMRVEYTAPQLKTGLAHERSFVYKFDPKPQGKSAR